MSEAVVPYIFEGEDVRVVLRDGEPWFVLTDATKVLGIRNSRDSAKRLDDTEKAVGLADTLGGAQNTTLVSEAGLYTVILRCREAMKPGTAPYRFRKWVTAEMLPSIRKRGTYGVAPLPSASPDLSVMTDKQALDFMRSCLRTYDGIVGNLQTEVAEKNAIVAVVVAENAVLAPKAEALDRISTTSEGSMCIREAAKNLQMRPTDLKQYLLENKWLYLTAGGRTMTAYQHRINNGVLEHKYQPIISKTTGLERMATQVLVTAKGLAKLAQEMKPQPSVRPNGQLPLTL